MRAAHRGADLPVGGDVVGRLDGTVETEVQLELAGGVLVVAVGHVEAERLAVFDHVEEHRTEFFKLVDVVAVGLRDALGLGAPSSPFLSHIISGSIPIRNWKPSSSSNSATTRLKFWRGSASRSSPDSVS